MPDLTRPIPAPEAHCPSCGLDGEGVDRATNGVHESHYLCPAGHIWLTRWADLEVPA